MGSDPETLLKPKILRIDPIALLYHILSDMNTLILSVYVSKRGHAVAQVVDALRYKREGRGFDSSCPAQVMKAYEEVEVSSYGPAMVSPELWTL